MVMRETLAAMTNPITIRVFVHKSKAFLKIFCWFVQVVGDFSAGYRADLQQDPVELDCQQIFLEDTDLHFRGRQRQNKDHKVKVYTY